jgi:hypothetical protein
MRVASGSAIVGSPSKVRTQLAQDLALSGANFLSSSLVFGDIDMAEATRSLHLFATDIMRALRTWGEAAHGELLATA